MRRGQAPSNASRVVESMTAFTEARPVVNCFLLVHHVYEEWAACGDLPGVAGALAD